MSDPTTLTPPADAPNREKARAMLARMLDAEARRG